jgi:DNA-binding beta-propeller fold protein YncE
VARAPLLGYVPERSFGGLNQPRSVAVDRAGNLYIAEPLNQRVVKLNPQGQPLAVIGRKGDREGEFQEPTALVVNARDELVVLDAVNGWISRFAPDGRFLDRVAGPAARLFGPRGLALDGEEGYLVADTGQSRIVRFDLAGRQRAAFGVPGLGPGSLREPTDAQVLADGTVVVVDPTAGKLIKFSPSGSFLAEVPFNPSPTVAGPHLLVLPEGGILATDPAQHQLLWFDADLRLRGVYGSEGEAPGQFRVPVGLAVDGAGRLYVAEANGNRVQRLQQ